MYALRTVDVWDTLLRRECHPECIKVIVAHHVFLRHTDRLLPRYGDHWGVYRARLDIEKTLAQESLQAGGDGEYTVAEVVQRWLQAIAPGHHLDDTVKEIIEYEYLTEIAYTTHDREVAGVLEDHPAERTIFLSDFYWPADLLLRLLSAKGLDRLVTSGLCSCDVGLNKRSGRLFRHVLDTYRVEPAAVVHIGDNPYSDVSAAQSHGIHAVHFQPTSGHSQRLKREKLFSDREYFFAEAEEQTRAACEVPLGTMSTAEAEAFRAGADIAPLFVGFSLFIAERAIRDHVQHVFFLMREGEFLRRVFEVVHPDKLFRGHVLPEISLLAVSRAATFAPTVFDPVTDLLEAGRWPHRQHPLASLVDAIGVDRDDVRQALRDTGLHLDEIIADTNKDNRIRAFLAHPDVQRAARAANTSRRDRLTDYLRSQGFVADGRYAVVDVGWRGTIQSHLAHLGLADRLQGYYLALHRPAVPTPRCCELTAYVVDEARSSRNVDLLDTYAVMEMLCTADVGSTADYRREGGGVVPHRSETNEECPCFSCVVAPFQDGVVCGSRVWASLIARYGLSAADLNPVATSAWRALASTPAQVLVDAFNEMTLDDANSHKRAITPADLPDLAALATAFWDRRAWTDLRDYLRRIRWRQALHPSSSRWSVRHQIVGTLLRFGSWYRRAKGVLRRKR
jgi:FMN phosphatase YigB (HAD superfamily)